MFFIVLWSYQSQKRQILHHAHQGMKNAVARASNEISRELNQKIGDLFLLTQSPLFPDYHNNMDYQLEEEAEIYRLAIEKLLVDFSKRVKVYSHLCYLGADGREVVSITDHRAVRAYASHAQAEYFLKARASGAREFQWSFDRKTTGSTQSINLARRISSPDGSMIGVLVLGY
ncbi:PDC sensor domain-containing protein, partial [Elusimicrobiota bacterium]